MLGQQWFIVQPNDNKIVADELRQPFAKTPHIILTAVNRSTKCFVARQVHFRGSTEHFYIVDSCI
jgi:hypothetical protein